MNYVKFLKQSKCKNVIYSLGKNRAKNIFSKISPFIKNADKIIDIGCGTCNLDELILKKNIELKPIDVDNLSFVDTIIPEIYDGVNVPYKNNSFNISLLITVLHHTSNPDKLLLEAARVSRQIIIIEDIYLNHLHKKITHFLDSIINLEFSNHPHSNKSDSEWKKLFKESNLKLIHSDYSKSFIFFRHALYVLKK